MVSLTQEQRQELQHANGAGARFFDPVTETQYVMIPADVFNRIHSLF